MEQVPEDLASPCPEKNADDKPYILCRKIKQMIDFEVNGCKNCHLLMFESLIDGALYVSSAAR